MVRLPVGEYAVTVKMRGMVMTLPAPVEVGLGEVTEMEARLRACVRQGRRDVANAARRNGVERGGRGGVAR